jgi:predicted nuclease of predicted toxin-antitoxin system
VRFLADMGVAHSTVIFLRAHGHDAVHLHEQGLQRSEDKVVIEKAQKEDRVILIHNLA